MLAMGGIALLQVCCLPGLIVLRLLRVKGSAIQQIVSVFALSLIAGYAAVLLLTAAGLFLRPVVLALIALEVFAVAWLYRQTLAASLGSRARAVWAWAGGFLGSFQPQAEPDDGRAFTRLLKTSATLLLAILALTSIAWVGRVFLYNLGTVFNAWDAVLSWNPWAVTWAQNRLPAHSGDYAQLIPANWAMIYVVTGSSTVQFFAKAIMPLFTLFILLMIFDLGLDERRMGFFLAVVLARLAIKKFLGDYINEGYVDLPLAFAGFLPVYTLLKAKRGAAAEPLRAAQLGLIFAGGAAITKQGGWFILALYLPLAYLLLLRGVPGLGWRQVVRSLAPALGAALLIVLPWYGYKQVQFWQGSDVSNVGYLTGAIYEGATLWERVLAAWQSLEKYAYLVLFLLPALAVLEDAYRWIVLLLVFPFTLFWALGFSYETRNLALGLPFLALAAGVGLGRCAEMGIDLLARLKLPRLRLYALAGVGLLALVALSFALPGWKLEERQLAQQKQIFNPELNAKLYDYVAQNGAGVTILTNYPVAYLPGLEDNQLSFVYKDFALYRSLMDGGKVTHLLAPANADEHINRDIERRLASGEYRLLFEEERFIAYRFIQVKPPAEP